MVKYEDIKLSPSDAFDIFMKKYPNTTVKEVELDTKSNSYVYKVKGYDDEKEYKIYINPLDGTVTGVKEKLRKGNYTQISKENTEKIQAIVDKALRDTGEGSKLKEWFLEIEGGMLELEVEIRLKNGKEAEHKYNLETGELLKIK